MSDSDVEQIIERKALLEQELQRYVRVLVEQDSPEKVIVFGSLITGELHPYSDIDLVVVKETELVFSERLRQMYHLLRPKVGTDILVYTPAEFAHLSEQRPFVQNEIATKGKVLYERDN